MAGVQCVLLVTVALAIALPSHGRPEEPMVVAVEVTEEEPRETFNGGFSPDFAHNLPTQEFLGDFANSDAALEGSVGFMSGVLDSFPQFASLGGWFGPMTDVEKINVAGNFMQEIDFPDVNIDDIKEDQPKFSPPRFPKQTRARQGEGQDRTSTPQDSDTRTSRTRREATEPDPNDLANIPHKRVHRVQAESEIPHSRGPREEFREVQNSQASHSETPLHFRSASGFQFPNFQLRRGEQTSRGRLARFQSATHIPAHFTSQLRDEANDDTILTESQRFYPTFNGRHPPFPPSRQPFFPSPPLPSRVPGLRNGRFIQHNQGHRESSSHRDFHNSFHGPPGVREAFRKPDLTFTPSRRPFHREHEFENHANSLLGSGNFEMLSGGTFYDDGDPHLQHQEYDHLLEEEEYGTFPGVQSQPYANNYVDNFFSNFRDFSEFAARKSDEGESTIYLDDEAHYSRGYASEHIQQIAAESTQSDRSVGKKDEDNQKPSSTQATLDDKIKINNSTSDTHKHRRPKNIQEVLEEVDPRPSDYSASSITVDEKDPMIAMF